MAKTVKKLNLDTGEYEPYELPKGSIKICTIMGLEVTCADCGKPVPYGNAFTSKRIFGYIGYGYAICGECYRKEIVEFWEKKHNES
jgi:hypothetical protein